METNTERPPAYRVDAPLRKVQSLAYDGDTLYIFRHDLARLDASNFSLVTQHENDTMRVSEQIAKGQFRRKVRSIPADVNLYKALIQSGGWRLAKWEPCRDEESIPTEARSVYEFDESAKMWTPGWFELTREQMAGFTAERQSHAIENMSRASGEYVAAAGLSIAFMYEKAGTMRCSLSIGEPDAPAYKLLIDLRRPDSKRRTRFNEDFAFGVEHAPTPGKKNDLGKIETKIDIEAGVTLFDEFFLAPVDDPEYSPVVFASGLEPEIPSGVRPYQEDDRALFLSLFDPNYKMELAAAMVGAFSKTQRDLPKE